MPSQDHSASTLKSGDAPLHARSDTRLTVAIVDDDGALRATLARGLAEEGFAVAVAVGRGRDVVGRIGSVDLVVLDIGLPDADGRDVLLALRAAGFEGGVLLLSARGEVEDRLSGFHAGADDYLPKPFSFDELVLRLRALAKRRSRESRASAAPRPIGTRLDHARHALVHAQREVALTPTEFRMLAALMARSGEVVSRTSLRSAGWPYGEVVHDNTLDSFVGRLRRALRESGSSSTITTIRGVGYRYDA
jgi:two-component system, OmpR family, response regulator